jgi:hypothetical protein
MDNILYESGIILCVFYGSKCCKLFVKISKYYGFGVSEKS